MTEGEVLEVRPYERLVYRWHTTVTWTLIPTSTGALLRMEQLGFRPQDEPNFRVATRTWQRFVRQLEEVLASLPNRQG